MAEPQNEKQRIVLELGRTRVDLADQSLLVRQSLDLNQKLTDSVRKHSWAWMSCAAIFGWILSRLPARKKKVYLQSANPPKEKRRGGALRFIWDGAWSVAKPLLTAYLAKVLAQKANLPGSKWL